MSALNVLEFILLGPCRSFLYVNRKLKFMTFEDGCLLGYSACCKDDSSSWWWRQQRALKRWQTSTRQHGATNQKTAIFILTAVRTSNLTLWHFYWKSTGRAKTVCIEFITDVFKIYKCFVIWCSVNYLKRANETHSMSSWSVSLLILCSVVNSINLRTCSVASSLMIITDVTGLHVKWNTIARTHLYILCILIQSGGNERRRKCILIWHFGYDAVNVPVRFTGQLCFSGIT
jgi:hypothetical protein